MEKRKQDNLTCTEKNGDQFIIEVQRDNQFQFKDRALYYASKLINSQAPKGKEWDYSLKEVYFIGIMDFTFHDSSSPNYIHRIHLTEEETGEIFYDKLGFIYLEIPKFNLEEKMLKTGLDRWMYVLKNMSSLQKIPVILNKKIFEKLFHIASSFKPVKGGIYELRKRFNELLGRICVSQIKR